MIEKTLKTTHGKLSIKIPSQLFELTLGQLMDMQQKDQLTDLDAISILSGVAIDELKNVLNITDFDVFGEAVLSLSDQLKYLYKSGEIPSKITFTIDGKPVAVKVIRNLSVEPAGAFMAAREIIADEINEHIRLHGEEDWKTHFKPSLKACCSVLAHYFFTRTTGKKYNEYEAEEFCETVKKIRVTEALPIAQHFFMSFPNLSIQRTNCFRQVRQFWRRKRAYNLSKNLNISIPSTPFREAILQNGTIF